MEVALGTGEEKAGLRVELAGRVTLRGTVVDLEGAPIPGVEVMVSGSGSFRFGGDRGEKKFVTDAAGRFEIERAETGLVNIWAMASRGAASDYSDANFPLRIDGSGPVVELAPIRLARRQVKPGDVAGDLGFTLKQSEPGADPLRRRLLVAFVRPGGPAAAAGVQVGDEIVSVGGQDVTGPNVYLYSALARTTVGGVLRLGLARGATVEVAAGAPP